LKIAVYVDLDGYYVRDISVEDEVFGVYPDYGPEQVTEPEVDEETPEEPEQPPEEPDEEPEEPQEPEPPVLILVGYRVAIPLPAGLCRPKYDIPAWQAAVDAYEAALADYRAELAEYDPESEEPAPMPPATVNLRLFWTEGLTQAEIDAIRNAPRPPTIHDQVSQLQTESVDTMLALTEVYETNAVQDATREQEGVDTMLALTEAYELILELKDRIEALEATNGGGS
jgi:hypothetical protein